MEIRRLLFWREYDICLCFCYFTRVTNSTCWSQLLFNVTYFVKKSFFLYFLESENFSHFLLKKKYSLQKKMPFMPSLTCRNLLISVPYPSPPKPRVFGGGTISSKIVNFCPFSIKKFLGRLWDISGREMKNRPNFVCFRPNFQLWNFKNRLFLVFFNFFRTFFLKMYFFCQNHPQALKNDFLQLL